MLRRIEDFVQSLFIEAEATVKVFERIPDNLKSEKIHENVRSLERLAWHITSSNTQMLSQGGIRLKNNLEDDTTPRTMAEILTVYQATVKDMAEAVKEQWNDNELEDEVPMYGEMWKKGKLLYILLGHQGHHRSQMTVIMRALGIEVPGTWGPSREEWAAFGMPAQV